MSDWTAQDEAKALFEEASRLFNLVMNESDGVVANELRARHALIADQHKAIIQQGNFGHC